MRFKDNKWYNIGDVNPREHGGVFVRKSGDNIEVVETTNNEDHGGVGYTVQYRDDSIDYLKSRFESFKENPDSRSQDNGVGRFADWNRLIKMEHDGVSLDDIVVYLAADMVSYYGGDSEPDVGTNYWNMLGMYGIDYRNYK